MEPLKPDDPRSIGTYQLKARLGAGGMGQVYYARSRGGRPVAVKLVRADLAADPGFRRRFAAEVEATRRVGGFFTAHVVDADPDADPPWVVTAYIAGPSLGATVEENGPLPVTAVLTLGAGLAEGLTAVHEENLVHRDLKPDNILLADDGPRIIDFGIARALEGTTLTAKGAIIGTPAFMSPEQALGHAVEAPSDIFSLGSVLAFAATGHPPFGTGPHAAILYRIIHEEPDLARVPAPLLPLIRQCLAKDPARRPTLGTLLDLLETTTRSSDSGRAAPPEATAPLHSCAESEAASTRNTSGTPTARILPAVSFQPPPTNYPKEATIGAAATIVPPLITWYSWGPAAGLFTLPITGFFCLLVFVALIWSPRTELVINSDGIETVLHRRGRDDTVESYPWDSIQRLTAKNPPDRTGFFLTIWSGGGAGKPQEAKVLCRLDGPGMPRDEIYEAIASHNPSVVDPKDW